MTGFKSVPPLPGAQSAQFQTEVRHAGRHLALAALALTATLALAGCGGGGDWTTVTGQGCVDATVEKLNSMLDAGKMQKAAASMTGDAACGQHGKTFAGKYRCDGKKLQASCK